MSTVGKRVIYAGPADQANGKPLNLEGVALEGDILPGMVIQQVATGLQKSSVAATVFGQMLLIADKNQMQTRSVDDPWTINENMISMQPRSGEFFNVIVASGNNITVPGSPLSRVAGGKLGLAVTDGTEEIVAYADEIIDATASDTLVRVRIA